MASSDALAEHDNSTTITLMQRSDLHSKMGPHQEIYEVIFSRLDYTEQIIRAYSSGT